MKKGKLADYKEEIYKVYDLSASYYAYVHKEDGQFTDDLLESLKAYQVRKRESELFQYLNGLDIDTVKVIEAVMYIGRDYPFTTEEYTQLGIDKDVFDETIDGVSYHGQEKQIREDPNMILMEKMKEIDQGGKKSKTIIINRILEKEPLGIYLRRGINILGV